MRIVIAPDSFKGSASASAAATAIAAGWTSVRPADELELVPMADGGEGTLDAFQFAHTGSRRQHAVVEGPDGRHVTTDWLLLEEDTGVVELAMASGITLMDSLQPFDAGSEGFGQLIAHALDFGVRRLVVAIGGSASTDGGAGVLTALGARFLDDAGRPIARGNRGLGTISSADLSGLRDLPERGVIVLSDVDNPLLGASGAAAVFGPQKGASSGDVPQLDANLARFARLVGGDPTAAGAGAAGGVGFALMLWGAQLRGGAAAVAQEIGMPAAAASADLIITGEGRFDGQSAAGKAPAYVAELAAEAGLPVALVAGSIDAPTQGFYRVASLAELAGGVEAALADPVRWLTTAGATLARLVAD